MARDARVRRARKWAQLCPWHPCGFAFEKEALGKPGNWNGDRLGQFPEVECAHKTTDRSLQLHYRHASLGGMAAELTSQGIYARRGVKWGVGNVKDFLKRTAHLSAEIIEIMNPSFVSTAKAIPVVYLSRLLAWHISLRKAQGRRAFDAPACCRADTKVAQEGPREI